MRRVLRRNVDPSGRGFWSWLIEGSRRHRSSVHGRIYGKFGRSEPPTIWTTVRAICLRSAHNGPAASALAPGVRYVFIFMLDGTQSSRQIRPPVYGSFPMAYTARLLPRYIHQGTLVPIHSGEALNENFSNMAGWVPIPSIEPSRATALRPASNSALQAMKSIHGYSVSTNWAYSWQNLIAKQVKASAGCENGNGALSVNNNDNYKNSWTLKRSVPISDIRPKPALRVAYQGIPGAYSEEAAILTHPGCQPLPCQMCEMAVRSVECRHADRAILPVESASEGSIHRNYDLLLDGRLHIVGEIHLSISYCLLTAPGVKKEDVKRVISHPLAISQCQRTLTDLGLITVARQTVDDTAAAAHFIAFNNLRDAAAIASSRAAEIYGLQVLARGIQDDSCDVIRFVILAREPVPIPTCTDRPPKTSIVIAHDGELHVLFKVLSAFSFRNINLTKLESRPGMNNPIRGVDGIGESAGSTRQFQYVHYIDFEASMADRRAQNALAELREFTTFIRVLGSYPADLKT